MKKEFRLTADGVSELEEELASLNAQKPLIAEKIRLAREQGDLTENAEYQISKDELSRVDNRIAEVEHILQNVELIKGSHKIDTVRMGAKVSLTDQGGQTTDYTIVGTVEADPIGKKISDESPIGKALMGKKVGDKAEINAPNGKLVYTISAIS